MSDNTAAPIEAPKPFTVTLNIRRYNPEFDAEPYWQSFDVEMYSTDLSLIHI